jgi:hypothetical protein
VQNVYREQDQLKADVMLLGKEAVDAYKAGKLPYVSSELDWRYSVTGGGRQLPGMTLTGYAWVDDPGVKGMSAELFMNAADFKQVWPANEPKKENRPMTIKERMKAAFAAMRGGMSAEEAAQAEADINALPDVDPVALTNDQTPAPAVTPGAPAVTPGAPAVTPKGGTDFAAEVAALRAQLATQKQANATLTETVAQLAKNTREAANANAVDALCNSGNLPPAKAPLLKAILNNLPSTEAKVAYMAKGADGAEVSTEVDLHGAILQLANSEDYKALFASSGGVAPALESSPQAAGLSDEDVDGLVSSVRRTVDEGK